MLHAFKWVFLFLIAFITFAGLLVPVSYGEALQGEKLAASTVTFSAQTSVFDTLMGLRAESETGTLTSPRINLSEAWLKRRIGGLDLTVGRKFIRWGPGRYGTLLLSDNSPAFDLLRVEGDFGPVHFDEFTALVDSSKSKYFFGHRLEVKPFDGLHLGVGETALAAGNFTRWLFNPLPFWPYYLTQHYANKAQKGHNKLVNVGLGLDAEYTSRDGYRVYGEYLVDDKPQYAGDDVPDRTGYLIGFQIPAGTLNKKVDFGAEYTRINYYAYSHLRRETDYLHDGEVIGHWLGPDADDLQIETRYHLDSRKMFWLALERERHGEGKVGVTWDRQNNKDEIFLIGVVGTTHRIKLGFDYQYSPELLFSAGGSLGQVENQDNVSGASGLERGLWFRVKWEWNSW